MARVINEAEHEYGDLRVLDVKVSPIDMDDAVSTIENWIETRQQNYVCIAGVHGVMTCRHDEDLREIHNQAGMVTPDGMPLVWMANRLGFTNTRRVYGPDLMRIMTALSETRGYRQFYYGGSDGLADLLAKRLMERHPNLQVAGTCTPPFRPLTDAEDADIVERINAADPDIVWVGLSTPKQEYWMAAHKGRIRAPVMIGVGAAFDFLAGTKPQAPRWMQQGGLEWLYRLMTEPRRLWRRYFSIIPGFIVLALAQLLKAYVRPTPRPAETTA